jgi:hypothetical protein
MAGNNITFKKVLVLCQRKTGPLHFTPKRVEEIITPKIETLVKNIFKTTDYIIEYLSDKQGHEEGDVDILGSLEKNESDEFTSEFLLENKNSYSMVILNTCPFSYMPYEVIYKLLVEDGLMVFSAYPTNIRDSKFKLYIPPEDRFSNITTGDMDAVMYKKIVPTQSAGKLLIKNNYYKKNKSRKKKKNKSRKNIKKRKITKNKKNKRK